MACVCGMCVRFPHECFVLACVSPKHPASPTGHTGAPIICPQACEYKHTKSAASVSRRNQGVLAIEGLPCSGASLQSRALACFSAEPSPFSGVRQFRELCVSLLLAFCLAVCSLLVPLVFCSSFCHLQSFLALGLSVCRFLPAFYLAMFSFGFFASSVQNRII